jgi:hypothetical protein
MNVHAIFSIVDKAQLPEPIHEKIDSRPGCADHLCQLHPANRPVLKSRANLDFRRSLNRNGSGLFFAEESFDRANQLFNWSIHVNV